jgi:protein-S-isoprenylcysteine O-methyltransferase Ste14
VEDEMLHEQFGQEWEDWARRVPYQVVPFVM